MRGRPARVAPLTGDRQLRQSRHVVGLGVDHQPALLEAEIPACDPERLAHERVGAVGTDKPTGADGPGLLGRDHTSRVVLCDPTDGQLSPVSEVAQTLGHPATLDRDGVHLAGVTVERLLELGLEEHVVLLPTGWRQTLCFEAEDQLAVGAEPLVVRHGDELVGEQVGHSEGLQQPHDLVIEVHGAG